ncbi:MAG: polyprenyl synthetase family protein [Bacteroidales bacterium]|nr:polyprenyl synthetase family protein [Bacteroidales bacterium]
MYTIEAIQEKVKQSFGEQNFMDEPKLLYEPISYTLEDGGKRLRPVLLLAACDLFDGDCNQALNAAIGIEIFHNFTLLHDDIMDKSAMRRGKETVYKRWNENIAILSGDTMFAMAYRYFLKTPHSNLHQILDVFTETAIDVCNGQQYDMDFETQSDVSLTEYLTMISKKTAVLLAGALKIGSLYANCSETDREHLYEFGINIGLAFQLQDDLLDSFGDEKTFGKPIGTDIKDNKKTFLYLKALEQASTEERNRLCKWFSETLTDNTEKIKSVLSIYDKLDIKGITEKEIENYFSKGLQELEMINTENDKKEPLRRFVNQLLGRKY